MALDDPSEVTGVAGIDRETSTVTLENINGYTVDVDAGTLKAKAGRDFSECVTWGQGNYRLVPDGYNDQDAYLIVDNVIASERRHGLVTTHESLQEARRGNGAMHETDTRLDEKMRETMDKLQAIDKELRSREN